MSAPESLPRAWGRVDPRALCLASLRRRSTLLAVRNPVEVYRATGKAEEDGYIGSLGFEVADEGAYRERLEDPNHYGRPLIVRVGMGLALR